MTPVHLVCQMTNRLRFLAHSFLQTNSELEGRQTVKSIDELPLPAETALSIITPSKVCRILCQCHPSWPPHTTLDKDHHQVVGTG